MLSSNLNDMLATIETVSQIDGVAERDQAIIENRRSQEEAFLSQVLGLAQVEEGNKRTPTKYSDSAVVIDVDDEGFANTLMRLAQINGVAAGEIVPEKHDGGVKLHVMPHVFASDQMEDVREMVGLGLESDAEMNRFDEFVSSLQEKKGNPNHNAPNGGFAKLSTVKSDGGSRSFQFSREPDERKKLDKAINDPKNTFNKPHYRASNRGFKTRRNKPCGRAARPSWIKKMKLKAVPANKLWRRCHDYQVPDWVRKRGGSGAAAWAASEADKKKAANRKKGRAKAKAARAKAARAARQEANSTAGQVANMLLALRTRQKNAQG